MTKITQPVTAQTLPIEAITPTTIRTIEDAKTWLTNLHALGILFNPDDSADTVGNSIAGEWVPTFDEVVAPLMDQRMGDVWDLEDFDPHGYILDNLLD